MATALLHSSPARLMSVIVIDDSDQEEGSQSRAGTVSVPKSIADVLSAAKASSSAHPATSRRGRSDPTCLTTSTNTQIRQRSVKSQPDEIIEIDSDEFSGKPQLKRARTHLVRDGNRTRDQELSPEHGTAKVVHGSAVESGHVPRSGKMRKDFIWATARRLGQTQRKHKSLPARKQNHLRVNPVITLELSPVTASLWLAGGAVNKIIQKRGCIAVSSASSGGQPNDPEVPVQQDPYNRGGTLQIWKDDNSKGQSIILHGHCIIESPEPSEGLERTCVKCFTVNDISFDPNQSHLMASTGNNGSVQLWQDGEKLDNAYYKYPRAPHDVAYREKDSLMAVTVMNGCVYVHPTLTHCPLGDPVELRVAPPESQHSVGAIVWGQGASADTLFASSEAQIMTDYTGYHAAFDPDQGRRTYEFSAEESGDAMASDPDGARLALCTTAHEGTHFLRLYDIRRKDGQHPLQTIQLDTFIVGPDSSPSQLEPREGEVRAVGFSPDGLLLAVSRSDDELHIYDSRFMGRSREPMRRFLHWEEDYCLGGDRWGIVDAVWVDGWCGRGLGVVTGGSDGCVRFWDVRRSGDDISNGEVLARPDSDIGHFSVGDPYNGEKPLVVGDNGGRLYVYDHATASGSTC